MLESVLGPPAGDRQRRPIIKRKLEMPATAKDVVVRARLSRRLRELLEHHQVVTVFATAGAGKTTAVALAVRELDRPVAWLSLDGTEQAAGRLLVYLEAAVEGVAAAAAGVAADALGGGLPTGEAAGLLAESLQGSRLIVVCDNVERVAADENCRAVLSSFARYLPPDVNLVLISRVDIPLDLGSTGERDRLGELPETDLAFDVTEAGEALRAAGHDDVDPARAVSATAGWVAGVLCAGRPPAPCRQDGKADPDSPLSPVAANIFNSLSAAERTFLLHTSVLEEISVDRAQALGQRDAARIMAGLRARHLPVTWTDEGSRLTPHRVFRDVLLAALDQQDAETVAEVRRRHAGVLIGSGRREEAVDELLRVPDVEAAARLAVGVLPGLVARMDVGPAARWLDAIEGSVRDLTPEIASVLLRMAFALDQCGRAVALIDRHGYAWLPDPGEPGADETYVLVGWFLWQSGRIADARAVAGLPPGRSRDIARTLIALATGEEPPPLPERPAMPSGPLDGLLVRLAYLRGRLEGLDDAATFDPWCTMLAGPWVIAALRATGRLDAAMAMYEPRRDWPQPVWLHAVDAVDLMLDLGREADAWAALEYGRRLVTSTGSKVLANISLLAEAKLWLRLKRDTRQADRVLAEAAANGACDYAVTRDTWQLWSGLSMLLQGRDAEALERILRALFGGRDDTAGRSYLRQALYRLREVLPAELGPAQEGNVFHLGGPEVAASSAQRVVDLVVQAGRQDGEARFQTLSQALARVGRGAYLAPFSGEWVEERRATLGEIFVSARVDAARLAYRMNRYREAKDLIDVVLAEDPYREQAWQLAIQLAHASGCDDTVLVLYQRYVARMRDLGVAPSDEVRRFVADLRK